MTKEQLVKKWIDDMVASGHMQGWFGNKGDEFKQSQYDCMMKVLAGDVAAIGGNYRLLATIHSDYTNLKQSCAWSDNELQYLLAMFGFGCIEQVLALMNCDKDIRNNCMHNGKLKLLVSFEYVDEILTPKIHDHR